MRRQALVAFLAAGVLGAAIWAMSPLLTGRTEPWDASGPFYVCALAIAGALSGFIFPKHLWVTYLGAIAGQLAYELAFLQPGPLLVLGVVFLFAYGIVFIAAAAVAGRLWRRGAFD